MITVIVCVIAAAGLVEGLTKLSMSECGWLEVALATSIGILVARSLGVPL